MMEFKFSLKTTVDDTEFEISLFDTADKPASFDFSVKRDDVEFKFQPAEDNFIEGLKPALANTMSEIIAKKIAEHCPDFSGVLYCKVN